MSEIFEVTMQWLIENKGPIKIVQVWHKVLFKQHQENHTMPHNIISTHLYDIRTTAYKF